MDAYFEPDPAAAAPGPLFVTLLKVVCPKRLKRSVAFQIADWSWAGEHSADAEPPIWQEWLESWPRPNELVLLAVSGDELVGALLARRRADRLIVELVRLLVAPGYRRRRVATALVNNLAYNVADGWKLLARSRETNAAACSFFTRHGFTTTLEPTKRGPDRYRYERILSPSDR